MTEHALYTQKSLYQNILLHEPKTNKTQDSRYTIPITTGAKKDHLITGYIVNQDIISAFFPLCCWRPVAVFINDPLVFQLGYCSRWEGQSRETGPLYSQSGRIIPRRFGWVAYFYLCGLNYHSVAQAGYNLYRELKVFLFLRRSTHYLRPQSAPVTIAGCGLPEFSWFHCFSI